MLSPRNGVGLEAKSYGLVASCLGLVDAVASASSCVASLFFKKTLLHV